MSPLRISLRRPLVPGSIAIVAVLAGVWFLADDEPARATSVASAEPARSAAPLLSVSSPRPTLRATAPARPAALTTGERALTPRASASARVPLSEEREARTARARRELEQLMRQDPTSFLAVFDLMAERAAGTTDVAPVRRATERYIAARSALLQRMQARFIDDADADHGRELEELERLDQEFRRELDWHAQRVPEVANLDEILATTTLKLPSFIAPSEVELLREASLSSADPDAIESNLTVSEP